MKTLKILLSAGLFLILFLPFVCSVSIELNSEYDRGETLIAKVSGNFVDNINKGDIFFYRRHMQTSIAEYDLIKVENQFFIYAKLGIEKVPDNYSIQIKNVRYMNGSQISQDPIIGNFSITGNTSDFWISPGAQIVDKDYLIQVQNLQPETITININSEEMVSESGGFFSSFFGTENETTSTSASSIEILSGEIKDIEFSLEDMTILKEIKLSSENTVYFSPIYNIYVPGNITIEENNTLNYTGEGTIIEEDIINEDPNEEIIINEDTGETITRKEAKTKTCDEVNGSICNTTEICGGTTFYASDSLCCLGKCALEKKNNSAKIIGWVLMIAVGLILVWFLSKRKNTKGKPLNLLNIGSKK